MNKLQSFLAVAALAALPLSAQTYGTQTTAGTDIRQENTMESHVTTHKTMKTKMHKAHVKKAKHVKHGKRIVKKTVTHEHRESSGY